MRFEIHRDGSLVGTFQPHELDEALNQGRVRLSDTVIDATSGARISLADTLSQQAQMRVKRIRKLIGFGSIVTLLVILLSYVVSTKPKDASGMNIPLPQKAANHESLEIIEKALASIVEVVAFADGNASKSGTGFVLSTDGVVATNAHLVTNASKLTVRTLSGAEYRVKRAIHSDVSTDVALIQLEAKNTPYIKLSEMDVSTGMSVLVVGNPEGMKGSVSEGIVAATRTGKGELDAKIQITAPISAGSSGSPVLNLSGEAVGMVSFKLTEGDALGFAIPSSVISQALQEVKSRVPDDDSPIHGNHMYSFEPGHAKDPIMQRVEKVYQGDSDALAIDAMLAASKAYPECVPVKLMLAERYQRSGDSKSSTRLYEEVLRIHPENRKAPLGLVDGIYASSDQWPSARKILEEAIRRDPLNFRARLELSNKLSAEDYSEKAAQAREAALIAPFHVSSVQAHVFTEALSALKSRKYQIDDDFTRDPDIILVNLVAYASLFNVAVTTGIAAVEGKPESLRELIPLLQKSEQVAMPLVDDVLITMILRTKADHPVFLEVSKELSPLRDKHQVIMDAWRKDWSYPAWTIYPRLNAEFLNENYYSCAFWRNHRNDPFDLFAAAVIPDLEKSGRHARGSGKSVNNEVSSLLRFAECYKELLKSKYRAFVCWADSRNLGKQMDPPRSPLFELWIQMWSKACMGRDDLSAEQKNKLTDCIASWPTPADSIAFASQTKNYSTGKLDEMKFFENGSLGDVSVEAALTWSWITAKEKCMKANPTR